MLATSSEVPVAWIGAASGAFVALLAFLGTWMTLRTRKQDTKVDQLGEMVLDRLATVERELDECKRWKEEHLRDHHGHDG